MSIGLIAVGRIERAVLSTLQAGIGQRFHCPVLLGGELPEPVYAFDKRRNQYSAAAILQLVRVQAAHQGHARALGITEHDLYAPACNFVFGLASGTTAVVGLARLRQEFYGLQADHRLFLRRALTEAVHELGHTYGLPHCRRPQCVMFFSNTLLDTDRKSADFCLACHRRLQ